MIWRKGYRRFFALIATIIILLALLLNAMRASAPLIEHYHADIERWSSRFIGLPVKIHHIRMTWYGYEPALKLNAIQVYDRQDRAFVAIKHITVAIDLWASLIKLRWLPGRLRVDGLQLAVHQDNQNQYRIGQARLMSVHLSNHSHAQPGLKAMFQWLLTQADVRISHVNIWWYGRNNLIVPLHNIELSVKNSNAQHRINGRFSLAQAINTQVDFSATLHSDHIFDDQLQAKFYIDARRIALSQWAMIPKVKSILGQTVINSGTVDAKSWGEWRQGGLVQFQSQLQAKHISLTGVHTLSKQSEHKPSLMIKQLDGHLLWQRIEHGWKLVADNIHLNINHHQWRENQLVLHYATSKQTRVKQWKLALSHFNLADISGLLLSVNRMPEVWHQKLITLNPVGEVSALQLAWSSNPAKHWRLQQLKAWFNRVSWHQYARAPAVSKLSGNVNWYRDHGELQLDSPGLFVETSPWIDSKSLAFNQAKLRASWSKKNDRWSVQLQRLMLDDGNLALSAKPSAVFWQSGHSPRLQLKADFHMRDISTFHRYLPRKGLPVAAYEWLQQAFLHGELKHGQLHFSGALDKFPFDNSQGDFRVEAEPWNVVFRFSKDWPTINQLSGRVVFHDSSMKAEVGFAKTAKVNLHQIHAVIPDFKNSILHVRGQYSGTLDQAHDYIGHTPMTLAKEFKKAMLSGLMKGNLALIIPIHHDAKIQVKGDLAIRQGLISLPQWKTSLSNIQGDIRYSDHSCDADQLSATFLNRPVHASINTLHRQSTADTVQVTVGGSFALNDVQKHYQLPKLPYVNGDLHYRAFLRLYPFASKQSNTLSILSDGRGLSVLLPEPLAKKTTVPRELYLRMELNQKRPLHVEAKYGKLVRASLTYKTNNKKFTLDQGLIQVGRVSPKLPHVHGLAVAVNLPYINFAKWQKFYRHSQQQFSAVNGPLPDLFDIRFTKVIAANMLWTDFHLRAQPQQKAWFVQLNSKQASGQMTIKPAKKYKNVAIKAELARFDYVPLLAPKQNMIGPDEVPAVNMHIGELRYRHSLIGQTEVTLVPTSKGIKLTKLEVKSPHIQVSARGEWTHTKKGLMVQSAGSVKFSALGGLLKRWGITDALAGGHGMVGFQLSWPGRLLNFKLANATGKFNIAVDDGRILNISKQTQSELGLGRFLNLLSMQSLPKRLVLNFGDLNEKGFAFDEAKGSFSVAGGIATTQGLQLNGSQADVDLKGSVGLVRKTYNLYLEIKPKVTGSIPFIATVTGGPFAGAIAWVVNKLFVSPTIGRAAMASYHISGHWKKPIVKKVE